MITSSFFIKIAITIDPSPAPRAARRADTDPPPGAAVLAPTWVELGVIGGRDKDQLNMYSGDGSHGRFRSVDIRYEQDKQSGVQIIIR